MFNQHMSIKKIWSIYGTINKIRRCKLLPPSLFFPMSADVYFFLKDIGFSFPLKFSGGQLEFVMQAFWDL